MANPRYQYGTSPRKVEPNESQRPRKQRVPQKQKLKVVRELPRQEIKVSKEQKKRQNKLTLTIVAAFVILLAISYQNSQINVKFNEMQTQKKELASLQKENEQLKVGIENGLNLNTIEKEAKSQLGMDKLTNKQTLYISLPKKDYVESASEKVEMEETANWFQKIINRIVKK